VDECKPLSTGSMSATTSRPGMAVQIYPIKPTLKLPESKLLKLTYGELLSTFAFNFNLRRYAPPALAPPTPASPNPRPFSPASPPPTLAAATPPAPPPSTPPSAPAPLCTPPKHASRRSMHTQWWQGLTLVHFSAQPELFYDTTYTLTPPLILPNAP